MNEKEILKEAMDVRGVNQTQLAELMGYRQQSSIGNLFMRKSMTVERFVRTMDVMGYDVVVRGRQEVKAPGSTAGYIPEWAFSVDENLKRTRKPELEEDI